MRCYLREVVQGVGGAGAVDVRLTDDDVCTQGGGPTRKQRGLRCIAEQHTRAPAQPANLPRVSFICIAVHAAELCSVAAEMAGAVGSPIIDGGISAPMTTSAPPPCTAWDVTVPSACWYATSSLPVSVTPVDCGSRSGRGSTYTTDKDESARVLPRQHGDVEALRKFVSRVVVFTTTRRVNGLLCTSSVGNDTLPNIVVSFIATKVSFPMSTLLALRLVARAAAAAAAAAAFPAEPCATTSTYASKDCGTPNPGAVNSDSHVTRGTKSFCTIAVDEDDDDDGGDVSDDVDDDDDDASMLSGGGTATSIGDRASYTRPSLNCHSDARPSASTHRAAVASRSPSWIASVWGCVDWE